MTHGVHTYLLVLDTESTRMNQPIIVVLLMSTLFAEAGDFSSVIIHDDLGYHNWDDEASVLKTTHQAPMSWQAVMALDASSFDRSADFNPEHTEHWAKITVQNVSDVSQPYYLTLGSNIDFCTVFVIDQHQRLVAEKNGGEMLPVSERPYTAVLGDGVIPIQILPGTTTLLLRATTARRITRIRISKKELLLIGASAFQEIYHKSDYIQGIMSGVFLVMIILVAILFSTDQRRINIWIGLYLLLIALDNFIYDGYAIKYFISDRPWLNIYLRYISGLGAIIVHQYLILSLIGIGKNSPLLSRLCNITMALLIFLFFGSFLLDGFFELFMLTAALMLVPIFIGMYHAIRARHRIAYFYLPSYVTLLAYFWMYIFRDIGWLDHLMFHRYFKGQIFLFIYSIPILLGVIDHFFAMKKESMEKKIEGERALRLAEERELSLAREQNVKLEQMVRERTLEIEQKNQQLLKLDEMKSRFFANISHEFRTPLTLIAGPVENHLAEGNQVFSKNELNNILEHTNQLLNLINQLLDLAKSENGMHVMSMDRVSMTDFINHRISQYQSFAKAGNKKVVVQNIADVSIWMDCEKMGRAFDNILFNALKYSPEDTSVFVNCYSVDDKVYIEIRDEGSGIPADQRSKVFDRFYQMESDQIIGGSGIGLALAKEFVQLHEGHIRIEENEPTGAVFIIEIPSKQVEINKTQGNGLKPFINNQPEFQEEIAEPELPQNENEPDVSVLVIEDNKDLSDYITSCLAGEYMVHHSKDGDEGVKKATALIPDLIISDVMMPIMDGVAMTRILKNDQLTSHIPIILLTAKNELEDKVEGLESGADDYITKPFKKTELLARIRSQISNRNRLKEKYGKDFIAGDIENIPPKEQAFLQRVEAIILDNLTIEGFEVTELSQLLNINRATLYRKIKALTNQNTSTIIRSVRLKKAKELLHDTDLNISEVAYAVGFSSPAYFSKCFKNEFGRTPNSVSV